MDRSRRRPSSLQAFGAMLRAKREGRDLSLEALARVTGISKPYLAHIETARAPGPPSEGKLRVLEKALGFDEGVLVEMADWLRTPASIRALVKKAAPRRKDGAIDLDALVGGKNRGGKNHGGRDRGDGVAAAGEGEAMAVRPTPVINRVAAGTAAEHTDLDYPAGVADRYLPIPAAPPARGNASGEEAAAWKSTFACEVFGDSMLPAYAAGEWVIVAPVEPAEGDDCVVRLGEADNFATTLKRVAFVRRAGGATENATDNTADNTSTGGGSEGTAGGATGEITHVRLVPLNAAFAERVVPMESVTGIFPVLYKMSAVRRRGGA